MHFKTLITALFLLLSSQAVADISRDIQSQIQQIFGSYAAQKSDLIQDKTKLHQFVQQQLSPKLANISIAKYLIGQHWKTLSREQKKRWIEVVTDTLIRYSMRALESYDVNDIDWSNSRFEKQGALLKMSTNVRSSLQMEIPIDLLIKVHNKEWGILDISAINFSFLALKSKEYQGFLKGHQFEQLLVSLTEKNTAYFCQFQACQKTSLN